MSSYHKPLLTVLTTIGAYAFSCCLAGSPTTSINDVPKELPTLKTTSAFHRRLYMACEHLKLSMTYQGPLGKEDRALAMDVNSDDTLCRWTICKGLDRTDARPILFMIQLSNTVGIRHTPMHSKIIVINDQQLLVTGSPIINPPKDWEHQLSLLLSELTTRP